MMRGHSSRHTLTLYLRPTIRNATLEPETALRVSSRFERSAATTSAAPGTSLGFRLTSRIGSLRALSTLTSSLPIAPPAPRMLTILRILRRVADHFNYPRPVKSAASPGFHRAENVERRVIK